MKIKEIYEKLGTGIKIKNEVYDCLYLIGPSCTKFPDDFVVQKVNQYEAEHIMFCGDQEFEICSETKRKIKKWLWAHKSIELMPRINETPVKEAVWSISQFYMDENQARRVYNNCNFKKLEWSEQEFEE